MSCCIFVGPSLLPQDRSAVPEATWLPPAKQGDVYRAVTLLKPRIIGIVDGYFQWTPAVWHKEILWALECGVQVFGAASMGALRAAELAPYGMSGVGRVYDAYRTGILAPFPEPFEDDDEVAVVHGPAESGYLVASEAMVNIRFTLLAAEGARLIGPETRTRLAAIAKSMFFPDRNYEALLEEASADGIAGEQLAALRAWLPAGRVNQKRADAMQLLDVVRRHADAGVSGPRPGFRFEHTTLWERVVRDLQAGSPHAPDDQRVLDEFRLDGEAFLDQWQFVCRLLTDPGGAAESPEDASAETDRLSGLARAHVVSAARAQLPRFLVERHVLARLLEDGRYSALLRRARDKDARLAVAPSLHTVHGFDDLLLLRLEDWYFGKCLGTEIPDDLPAYVSALGYADRSEFHRAVFGEHLYRKQLQEQDVEARPSTG